MNQPRSTNPALTGPGRLPGQQPAAQPQQQQQPPQQQPGSAGLLGPDGRPIQAELLPLRINPDGVTIPTTTYNSAELVAGLGNSIPYSMVITWLEVAQALSQRDAVIGYLERRIEDLEKGLGRPPITYEQFIQEMMQQQQQMLQQQQQGMMAPPAGSPPGEPPR